MGDFEDFEGDFDGSMAEPEKKKPRKRTTKKKTAKPPTEPPFQIHRRDPTQSKYLWIKEHPGRKAPGPADIRAEYGPGSFRVTDAAGNEARWQIGADPSIAQTEPEPAPIPEPYEPPREDPRYHPPAHAPAYGRETGGADPSLYAVIYRQDAAIQSIERDVRRVQDELRSTTYELQQVPIRTAERVASVMSERSDPFDQMSKVWEMSQRIADGKGPDEGGGIADVIAGGLAALGSKMGPPPPPQPANGGGQALPAPDPASPELPGMTQDIRAELIARAQARGIDFGGAVETAKAKGWTASQLLEFARRADANAAAAPAS